MTDTKKTAYAAVACGNILGETPVWSAQEQALYWVDIRAPAIQRFKPLENQYDNWEMPELCGGLVLAKGGGIIVAFRNEIAHFDPLSGVLIRLAQIEPRGVDNRLNELKCDRAGRLWIGSMRDFGAEVEGSLYKVESALLPQRMLSNIRIPNSLGWSPDDAAMYFADTGELTLKRYDYDVEKGLIGAGRVIVGPSTPGRPDGCAVDSDGCIWNARYGTGNVVRVDPDGKVLDTITIEGALQVTSCALGGPDLKTLYVTSAKQKLNAIELSGQRHAGDLFAISVEVPGLVEPAFRFDRSTLQVVSPDNGRVAAGDSPNAC